MPAPTGHESEKLEKSLLARLTTAEREHLDVLAKEGRTSVNSALRELIQRSLQKRRYEDAMAQRKARGEERTKSTQQDPQTPPAAPAEPKRRPQKTPEPPRPQTAAYAFGSGIFREPETEQIPGQTDILDDDQ